MKTKFLHFLIFLFAFTVANQNQAQVTIDQSNFLRGTTYIDTLVQAMPSALGAPSEGPDQVWDYSTLVAGTTQYTDHFAATNHPDFPSATTYYQSDLTFQGFPIENFNYEAVNVMGWSVVGQAITDVTYSITSITGGPSDSLRFVGGNYSYPVPNELINFPATYQNQWTNVIIGNTPFELTVAAFGLDKVPGNRKRTITSVRDIVGYGELTIPTLDGTASAPMDVLLMKTTRTSEDSIFLGGAPAPAALLAAFGLTQGSLASDTSYFFYKPGFGSTVLFHSPSDPEGFSYRPQAASIVSGIHEMNLLGTMHFPNPIAAGQALTIEMERPIAAGHIIMIDTYGRFVHKLDFAANYSSSLQFQLPVNLNQGLLIYQVHDSLGELVGVGKLQIQ